MSTAHQCDVEGGTFRVTHPFHPLFGREFVLVVRQRNCREDRVYYEDDEGKLCSLATTWTSVSPVDPFVALAAGRSPFRVSELLELCRLLDGMAGRQGGRGPGEEVRRV